MLSCITHLQFQEWIEFWQLEPFGDEWAQTGMVSSIFANAHRGRNSMAYKPSDFMPGKRRLPPAQTPEQQWAVLMQVAEEMKGRKK